MPLYKLYFYCCFHIIVKEKELTTDTRVTQVTESCELTFTVGFFLYLILTSYHVIMYVGRLSRPMIMDACAARR